MGYYTNYSMHVPRPDDELEAAQLMHDLGDHFDDIYNDGKYVRANTHSKWYDFEDDMRELSKQYPNLLFETDGAGEEPGDLWRCYVQNGKANTSTPRSHTPSTTRQRW